MSQNEVYRNYLYENICTIDEEDLHSITSIISLLLRIIKELRESLYPPQRANKPSSIDCNDGRSIVIILF